MFLILIFKNKIINHTKRGIEMQNMAVLGAGIMGHGVAQLFAQAGKNVRIQARRESSLETARKLITNSLQIMVEKEMLTQDKMDQTLARISYTTELREAIEGQTSFLNPFQKILN